MFVFIEKMSEFYVFFDFDGLLCDSESILYYSFDSLLEKHQDTLPKCSEEQLPVLKSKLIGHPFSARAKQLYDDFRFEHVLPFPSFVSELRNACLEHVTRVGMRLMPGAREITRVLREKGINLVICTGNDEKTFLETKRRLPEDFFKQFPEVICGEPEMKPKPDPEIYLKALKRFRTDSEHVLVFEDSEAGVLSARAAGLRVVHVLDRRLHVQNVNKVCEHVIYSLEEFELISKEFKEFFL